MISVDILTCGQHIVAAMIPHYIGVRPYNSKSSSDSVFRWQAEIRAGKVKVYLGNFQNRSEAVQRYDEAVFYLEAKQPRRLPRRSNGSLNLNPLPDDVVAKLDRELSFSRQGAVAKKAVAVRVVAEEAYSRRDAYIQEVAEAVWSIVDKTCCDANAEPAVRAVMATPPEEEWVEILDGEKITADEVVAYLAAARGKLFRGEA